MREHALLSASSAHRWMKCPPSARLATRYSNEPSEFAKEGTKAHELAEMKLEVAIFEKNIGMAETKAIISTFKDIEMQKATDAYVEHIRGYADLENASEKQEEKKCFCGIEKKVDFSTWVPDGFGTCDFFYQENNELHVFDFKYGKGIAVTAEKNVQMMLYALGVLVLCAGKGNVLEYPEYITMHIVQPRMKNYSLYTMKYKELIRWAQDELKPAARIAYDFKGEFKAGDHCKFCPHSGCCEERADYMLSMSVLSISPGMYPHILKKAELLQDWINSIKKEAKNALEQGEKIEGMKLVQSKTKRKLKDENVLLEKLESLGYNINQTASIKAKSINDLYNLLEGDDKAQEVLKEHIIKPEGVPTLAFEDDTRPELLESGFDFEE